ncbi:MAG: beta-lactamase family protein [Oscillospiraceae bacterium]|nr:beta-lactamase family protein [Oscillospiraceae bacterium]
MDRKAQIEKLICDAYEKDLFTGTWLYAENGEIVTKGAVGYSDTKFTVPMQENCIFDIGSISKHITCTAILLLRRKGLLDLDDEVTKFFPEIPYKGITVRHLMTHTSGLPDYMAWTSRLAKRENTIPDNNVIIRFLTESGAEPLFAPGEDWSYCNTGYCLLAEIVAKVSGVPFPEFLKKNIFEPAGMTSTALVHRIKDGLNIPNIASGMSYDDDSYKLSEESQFKDIVIRLDGSEGDGFIKTNIFDMLAWDRALREETVLTEEEKELMYTPVRLRNGEISDASYGFGWRIREKPGLGRVAMHAGGWPGYRSLFVRFLDTDCVFIYLCSRDTMDEWGTSTFTNGLIDIASDIEPKPVCLLEDMAIQDPDRSGWDMLCGDYEGNGLGVVPEKVFMKDGDLYGTFYHTEADIWFDTKLFPIGDNTFAIKQEMGNLVFSDKGLTFGDTLYTKQ